MSGSANLDLRTPIGLLFIVLGAILAIFGVLTRADTVMYAQSGGINLNLVWGVVMVLFGGIMTAFAVVARRQA
ncbi:hypothetical protein [Gemmatimonas sp.]|uniref:hypothetical protein n=1 Tax=Gemmatimonas sp. TaxID=1962908 RepID=UPI00286E55E6|nr:hypothetical protein [Gemmatimonas sp.]